MLHAGSFWVDLLIGAACGAVPLVLGFRNGRWGVAIGGFLACLATVIEAGIVVVAALAAVFAWFATRPPDVPAPAAAGQAPPGWYPDPQGIGRRWWDGYSWTEHHVP